MITVKRLRDDKVFSSDMSEEVVIIEIHFSTSYTQVEVQEKDAEGLYSTSTIICKPIGDDVNCLDLIAIQGCDEGEIICSS